MSETYLFKFQTVQSSTIRNLFEVLKDVLIETNLIICDKYIKLVSMDNSQVSLVHLLLKAGSFEYYECGYTAESPLIIGINTQDAFKRIKSITNSDTISMYVLENDPTKLRIKKENIDKNSIHINSINLYDIPYKEITIPSRNFDAIISFPSTEFQKICKDYNHLHCKDLEIKSVGQQLIFSGVCDDGSMQESIIGKSDNTTFDTTDSECIIQGKYDLKYLLFFTKATNLCNTVYMYLVNDYPLTLSYKVGSIGEIKFVLSSKT